MNLNDLTKIVNETKNVYTASFEYNQLVIAKISIATKQDKLMDLSVVPDFQGRGLAGQLIELAKSLGVTNLIAEAYKSGLNQKDLVAFYKRHGFLETHAYKECSFMNIG